MAVRSAARELAGAEHSARRNTELPAKGAPENGRAFEADGSSHAVDIFAALREPALRFINAELLNKGGWRFLEGLSE